MPLIQVAGIHAPPVLNDLIQVGGVYAPSDDNALQWPGGPFLEGRCLLSESSLRPTEPVHYGFPVVFTELTAFCAASTSRYACAFMSYFRALIALLRTLPRGFICGTARLP